MLCNISQNAMRQWGGPGTYPPGGRGYLVRYPPGGVRVPPRGVGGSGYPPWGGPGTPPPDRVPPWGGSGYPPQGGYPVRWGGGYPVRTTEGVLTTRRAVCLLRSRRRTFLLIIKLIECHVLSSSKLLTEFFLGNFTYFRFFFCRR